MGFLSGWKQRQREKFVANTAPFVAARNEIYNREIERLGNDEFWRRMTDEASYRVELEAEIMQRAHQLANGQA